MKIDIAQHSFKYTFYKKGTEEPIFEGYFRDPLIGDSYTELYNKLKELVVSIRIGNNPFFPWLNRKYKLTYLINFHVQSLTVEVTVQHFSKGHWTFKYKDDQYDFYRHRRHCRSLYKNDRQVAKYDKRSVAVMDYDRGYIISNNDEDELLLICLFLCYDLGEYRGGEDAVDVGHLTEGVRVIDPDWLPWK